jgi:putative phosphoesterase
MITQIAVIADIHGNLWALEAVLEDIERRGITRIVNLGDSLYGSLDVRGTAERLMSANIPAICGNQDRDIFAPSDAVRQSADHLYAIKQLNEAHINWLKMQPTTMVIDDVFCCHGTPSSDTTYLLEKVTAHGVFLNDTESILGHLQGITQPVIVCGHSHQARMVWLPNGQLVVNPGSVGIPAYYDSTAPYPHVMEAGSPHARYAILSRDENHRWAVEHIALPYDWHPAAAMARQHGREDRAQRIETGRAKLPTP